MLGPPRGDFCAGEQERQVGEISPALLGPPFPPEAQQNLDHVAKADVAAGRISTTSPIGRGLMGKRVGDTVKVTTPAGGTREFEVKQMQTIHDQSDV